MRPIFKQRKKYGEMSLLREMANVDPEYFYKYARMSPAKFKELLELLKSRITHSGPREPISAKERLAITLR